MLLRLVRISLPRVRELKCDTDFMQRSDINWNTVEVLTVSPGEKHYYGIFHSLNLPRIAQVNFRKFPHLRSFASTRLRDACLFGSHNGTLTCATLPVEADAYCIREELDALRRVLEEFPRLSELELIVRGSICDQTPLSAVFIVTRSNQPVPRLQSLKLR